MESLPLVPVVTFLVPKFLITAGFIASPVAALVAHHTARQNGLCGWLYPAMGMAYSMLLVAPLFMMMRSLRGESLPWPVLTSIYFCLYAVWLAGPIGLCIIAVSAYPEGSLEQTLARSFLIVMCVALALSLWSLFGRRFLSSRFNLNSEDENQDTRPDRLPPHRYVLPFLCTLCGFWTWRLVWFIEG